WTPNVSLKRDEVTKVPVWVKLHNVLVVAYSADGLSLIDAQVRKPIMLDAFTSSMCDNSWGQINYACALVEINAEFDLKHDVSMAIPLEDGTGHTRKVIKVEYEWKPPHCNDCKIFGHTNAMCPKRVNPNISSDNSEKVMKIAREPVIAKANYEESSSRGIQHEESGVGNYTSKCNEDSEFDDDVDEFIFPEGDKFGDKFDIRLKVRPVNLKLFAHVTGWVDDLLYHRFSVATKTITGVW
nr:hypothetical protein [Tanacetum cinerariifolium]